MNIKYLHLSKLVVFLTIMASLTSCHFGRDAEELRPSFADERRWIEYSFTAGFPFKYSSNSTIEDHDVDGLKVNWDRRESFALFGDMFLDITDTVYNYLIPPKVLRLDFDALKYSDITIDGGISKIGFGFGAWIKQGDGIDYSQHVSVLYPYSKVIDEYGNIPYANAKSLDFNFNEQDGVLEHLRNNYFIALGDGMSLISATTGTITTEGETYLRIVPKFAIVRLALTVSEEDTHTLREFVDCRSISESVRYIDNITISNNNGAASAFNKTVLDLEYGVMRASYNAQSRLIIRSDNAFTTLDERTYDNRTSLALIGGKKRCWGTMVYVALPCTDYGKLAFDGIIDVSIKEHLSGNVTHYYGKLQPIELEEGGYYLTSAVELTASTDMKEAAEILKVPGVVGNEQ
ncbi:MAG: hypothetical protein Q4B58_04215 [Bacteroidales bacterium]|nr:hypothetical protein [Bacteroidales bacterium]